MTKLLFSLAYVHITLKADSQKISHVQPCNRLEIPAAVNLEVQVMEWMTPRKCEIREPIRYIHLIWERYESLSTPPIMDLLVGLV